MTDTLLDSMGGLIARTAMAPPGAKILVAVSGGQDSCALLHGLATLRHELHITLHAAHLNHGFRGEEADADAVFVGELAASLQIPCTIERQDVPAAARRLHLSSQEAARRARHQFLERTASSVGADRIALGHTRDDRVETILLNILRGTGIDGLRGLQTVSGQRIRPLLEASREATAAYCRAHGISFREDASNRSLTYLRSRVREELLPLIETYYNPEVRLALLRLSDLADADAAFMQRLAQDTLARLATNLDGSCAVLSSTSVADLPLALRRRVVRAAIETVRGDLASVEFADTERALAAIEAETAVEFTLAGGDVHVRIDRERVKIFRQAPSASHRPFAYDLCLPGEVRIPERRFRLICEEKEIGGEPPTAIESDRMRMPAEAVRLPLRVRSWRNGDRMQPMGMAGTRKLQDIFADRKVPVAERRRTLIVEDAEGILWVAGYALSERCRIGADTGRVVEIRIERLGEDGGESGH